MAKPVAQVRPPSPCPCLTKKFTVIGTIGQTQGITSANNPPSAEASRNGINPCWARVAISLVPPNDEEFVGAGVAAAVASFAGSGGADALVASFDEGFSGAAATGSVTGFDA